MSSITPTDSDPPNAATYLLLPVKPPLYTREGNEYAVACLSDTLRHNITVPSDPKVNVPHGFYVIDDPTAPSCETKTVFGFFKGDNIHEALAATRAQAITTALASSLDEVQLPTNAFSHMTDSGNIDDSRSFTAGRPPPPEALQGQRTHSRISTTGTAPGLSTPSSLTQPRHTSSAMMVEPLRSETSPPTSGLRAMLRATEMDPDTISLLQSGILPTDNNSLIPLSMGATPQIARFRRLYTLEMQLYEEEHPQHIETVYRMPVDTATDVTWFYGHNFKKILDPGRRDHPIPWTEHDKNVTQVTKRRFIVPVERRTEDNKLKLVPFTTDLAPTTADEHLIRYQDGGAVYVRQMPEKLQEQHQWEVAAPMHACIWGEFVDRKPTFRRQHRTLSAKTFFDGLEWPEQAVVEPRRFFIKFTHPDHLAAALRNNAKDFLYFGNKFPCALKPRFTPRIMVYKSKPTVSDDVKQFVYRHWTVQMQSMSLIVPGEPLDQNPAYTIDFASYIKQLDPQESTTSKEQRGIYVTFDTADDLGSASTYLPPKAVETISKVWLKNDPDVQSKPALNRAPLRHPSNPYVGQERNLDDCDVLFKFTGMDGIHSDGEPVEFRCAAKLFFKLPWPVGGSGTSEGMFQSGIRPLTTENADANSIYIFGVNFFWAAFVEHCGPMLDLAHDKAKSKPAYIRLAPQRAKKPNGEMGGPEAFSLFPHLPPKYFFEPEES
ncbi:hypothetical protein C8Q79DRAFT_928296 [Trametes meyenii]|nr:hypothetical protein C8Q79DRAFT_928296 [Trametes meyenii]